MNRNYKNKLFRFTPSVHSLKMDLKNIVSATGYSDIRNFPYASLLQELYAEAKNAFIPKVAFVSLSPVESNLKDGEINVNGVSFKTEKIVTSSLKGISSVVLFVGTTGEIFDKWLGEKKRTGDPFIEYLADLIGSEIAESIAKWTHKKIMEIFETENFNCSNRYSPGYCGWNISEQKKIFSFFPKNICGITLTESMLMLPVKSVSGIVGIGKNLEWRDYPCDTCNVSFCYKNRRSVLI